MSALLDVIYTHLPTTQLVMQALTLLGVACGVFIAIRVQIMKILSDYSDKYNNAISSLPIDYVKGNFNKSLSEYAEPTRDGILLSCMRLFAVFAQEYVIRNKYGFISRSVWKAWVEGEKKNMRYLVLREAWDILQYRYHAEFVAFMNNEIIALRNDPGIDGWI